MRTGPKAVVVILHYCGSTDTSFRVVWWGILFEITVSPCCLWSRFLRAVVWAVGSNKSPWWLCPSLGILCSYWESGTSVARSWVRCGTCSKGSGFYFKLWLSDLSSAMVFSSSPIPSQQSHKEKTSQNVNWVHRTPVTCLWWEHVHAWRNKLKALAPNTRSECFTLVPLSGYDWVVQRTLRSLACRCNALW